MPPPLSIGDSCRILAQISYISAGLRRPHRRWDAWSLNPLLSALYIHTCYKEGIRTGVMRCPPHPPLYISKYLVHTTLSLCFRADFAHLFLTKKKNVFSRCTPYFVVVM